MKRQYESDGSSSDEDYYNRRLDVRRPRRLTRADSYSRAPASSGYSRSSQIALPWYPTSHSFAQPPRHPQSSVSTSFASLHEIIPNTSLAVPNQVNMPGYYSYPWYMCPAPYVPTHDFPPLGRSHQSSVTSRLAIAPVSYMSNHALLIDHPPEPSSALFQNTYLQDGSMPYSIYGSSLPIPRDHIYSPRYSDEAEHMTRRLELDATHRRIYGSSLPYPRSQTYSPRYADEAEHPIRRLEEDAMHRRIRNPSGYDTSSYGHSTYIGSPLFIPRNQIYVPSNTLIQPCQDTSAHARSSPSGAPDSFQEEQSNVHGFSNESYAETIIIEEVSMTTNILIQPCQDTSAHARSPPSGAPDSTPGEQSNVQGFSNESDTETIIIEEVSMLTNIRIQPCQDTSAHARSPPSGAPDSNPEEQSNVQGFSNESDAETIIIEEVSMPTNIRVQPCQDTSAHDHSSPSGSPDSFQGEQSNDHGSLTESEKEIRRLVEYLMSPTSQPYQPLNPVVIDDDYIEALFDLCK